MLDLRIEVRLAAPPWNSLLYGPTEGDALLSTPDLLTPDTPAAPPTHSVQRSP